jgi:hypothetical protein
MIIEDGHGHPYLDVKITDQEVELKILKKDIHFNLLRIDLDVLPELINSLQQIVAK